MFSEDVRSSIIIIIFYYFVSCLVSLICSVFLLTLTCTTWTCPPVGSIKFYLHVFGQNNGFLFIFSKQKKLKSGEWAVCGRRLLRLRTSKQIGSTGDPGWQHSGDNATDQLGPVSQTNSAAGAV